MLQPPSLPRSHHRQPGHTCKTSGGQTRLGRRHRQILRMRKRLRKPLLLCCPRRTPRDPTPDTSRLCPESRGAGGRECQRGRGSSAALEHQPPRHPTRPRVPCGNCMWQLYPSASSCMRVCTRCVLPHVLPDALQAACRQEPRASRCRQVARQLRQGWWSGGVVQCILLAYQALANANGALAIQVMLGAAAHATLPSPTLSPTDPVPRAY